MYLWYEHNTLRPRQLSRILQDKEDLKNSEYFENKKVHIAKNNSPRSVSFSRRLLNLLPLVNIRLGKRYFREEVKAFGCFVLFSRLHIYLDNPYVLTFYNVRAFRFFKTLIRMGLKRCVRITCMSQACRLTLQEELGKQFVLKLNIDVEYPKHGLKKNKSTSANTGSLKFLFIGSQFEIKGGHLLRSVVERLSDQDFNLTIISNLTSSDRQRFENCGCVVMEPVFNREDLFERVYPNYDVLLLPSFMESFGLVVLEAMSCGLLTISNDIYALRELKSDSSTLIQSEISKWTDYKANSFFNKNSEFLKHLKNNVDEGYLVEEWIQAIKHYMAHTRTEIEEMKRESLKFYHGL